MCKVLFLPLPGDWYISIKFFVVWVVCCLRRLGKFQNKSCLNLSGYFDTILEQLTVYLVLRAVAVPVPGVPNRDPTADGLVTRFNSSQPSPVGASWMACFVEQWNAKLSIERYKSMRRFFMCILYTVYCIHNISTQRRSVIYMLWFAYTREDSEPSLHEIILWRVKWRRNICRIQDLPTW